MPSSRLIAFATADSVGAFTLPRVADSGGLYLEVAQSPDRRPALQRDSLESLLLVYPSSLPDSLGTLALQAPGGLSGRLLSVGGAPDSAHWIGAQGTDEFTRLKADGTFRLDGLAPGPQTLVVVDVSEISIYAGMSFTVKFAAPPAATVAVKSKQVTDLGGMLYYTGTAPRIGVP